MRILNLTTHLNRGGISKYISTVGSAMVKRGHPIYVVSSGGDTETELQESGLTIKNLPIRTKNELSARIYLHLPELVRLIKEWNVDLMHAHTRVTQVMAWWAQRLTGRPFVSTVHGFYKRRLGRRLLPAWGERAVAISEPVGVDLRETHHVSPELIRIIYNGLDLVELAERFATHEPSKVRREYGFSESSYVIGIIARLVPDKGHEYLLRSLKELETEIPGLRVLVVGDGKFRVHLENLSARLGLNGRVHFTGNLRDVTKPLAAIDLFVLPAVWREGFGLSIVEAMACQKPVIVTNIWALNTLIQNQVNGVLVEPRNTADLSKAIRFFVQNPEFCRKIGEAGQATTRKRFSIDRMVQELEEVYAEVLSH